MRADPVAVARGGALPLAALVLARRVRALVAATIVHTLALAFVAWWAGSGPTLPSVAALAAHLAVSLGAALPVRWQFAGDPARRERRAVRAMTVSFVVLAVYSTVDAITDALAPGRPGETLVGGVLGVAGAVALPLLVAADARIARAEGNGDRGDLDPSAPRPAPAGLVAALSAVLLVAGVADLVAASDGAPSVGAPAVSAVVAVLAAREAWGAWHR